VEAAGAAGQSTGHKVPGVADQTSLFPEASPSWAPASVAYPSLVEAYPSWEVVPASVAYPSWEAAHPALEEYLSCHALGAARLGDRAWEARPSWEACRALVVFLAYVGVARDHQVRLFALQNPARFHFVSCESKMTNTSHEKVINCF
jgi:hypothetical protein